MTGSVHPSPSRSRRRVLALPAASVLTGLLAGCALVDKPVRPSVYDFGPVPPTPAAQPALPAPVVLLAEVETTAALDNTAVLYRLAYADAQQVQPYAQARWSTTPAQLLRQRMRDRLSHHAMVLTPGDAVATGAPSALLLQVELEEFSQVFDTPEASSGLVRLRATAVRSTRGAEQLLGQRGFELRRPAPSADARGGVRAMTLATDAAVEELLQWLTTLR